MVEVATNPDRTRATASLIYLSSHWLGAHQRGRQIS